MQGLGSARTERMWRILSGLCPEGGCFIDWCCGLRGADSPSPASAKAEPQSASCHHKAEDGIDMAR